jgi:4-phospho-D-threonate 3-dehydrogenase / 4-phospho-D-erythronate 3-dehydrogenase
MRARGEAQAGNGRSEPVRTDSSASSRFRERPLLAVTVGDPCGIGPEIVLKGLADERAAAARLIAIGDERNLRLTSRELRLKWPFAAVVKEVPEERRWDRPLLRDIGSGGENLVPGQVCAAAGRIAAASIEKAAALASSRVVDGIVTAPIHKEALSLAGVDDPGHTEMLARLTGTPRVAMLFWTEDFSVALLTTHMALTEAIRRIRKTRILEQLVFVEKEWSRYLGRRPRIAVAGLNPHSGEGGRFGVEEERDIAPAIEAARKKGLLVSGPVPPDAVFGAARGNFDLVFALYHDQATIPVKFHYGQKAVNVTLGLPFVRTSVDHGTAMDIAGKGIASEESLLQAIRLAVRLVRAPEPAAGE